jgi:hypothetical protein
MDQELNPGLATTFEIPYASAGGVAVSPENARKFGENLACAAALFTNGDFS